MTPTTYQQSKRHPVIRISNRIGRLLDRLHIELPLASFDETTLFNQAMRRTGLKDFGPEHFREPLRAILDAAKAERHLLTLSGRRAVHDFVFHGLCARLRSQKAITDHPDILEQPVRRPLLVAAAPRTGTTLMFNLLAQDPAARPLLMWESIFFTPWRSRREVKHDPRKMATAVGVWLAKRIIPDYFVAHNLGHDLPDECHWLLAPSFVWPPVMALPAYAEWLRAQPESTYDRAYVDYRRALQMLHWQRPAQGHWVLKSIIHIWALPSLLRAVPEASIVHTHRNMREVIPSFCSMVGTLVNGCSDRIHPKSIGPVVLAALREAMERDLRARQTIDPARVCDVTYAELVRDPVGTVRRIYDKFRYEFTPEVEKQLARFAARSKAAPRPKHVYSLEQFNLDGDAIEEAFADYHQKFGIAHG